MSQEISKNSKRNGSLVFLQEFLKHPLQIGSVIPSSRFLERRIVEAADVALANVIVELGPGTGGVTRALLSAMPQQATLLSIEINPRFNTLVSMIEDTRLIAHQGSAHDLRKIISQYGLALPDIIVSGIPFSMMSRRAGSDILEEVATVLQPKGRFVAYQVKNQVSTLCEPILGPAQISTELLNVPPMRVFQWVKGTEEQ